MKYRLEEYLENARGFVEFLRQNGIEHYADVSDMDSVGYVAFYVNDTEREMCNRWLNEALRKETETTIKNMSEQEICEALSDGSISILEVEQTTEHCWAALKHMGTIPIEYITNPTMEMYRYAAKMFYENLRWVPANIMSTEFFRYVIKKFDVDNLKYAIKILIERGLFTREMAIAAIEKCEFIYTYFPKEFKCDTEIMKPIHFWESVYLEKEMAIKFAEFLIVNEYQYDSSPSNGRVHFSVYANGTEKELFNEWLSNNKPCGD